MIINTSSQLIGRRYQLGEKVGAGGMGEVYRATDRLTQQQIALKRVLAPTERLIFSSRTEGTDLRLLLAQEFRSLASLRHPNIISVLDYGFDDQRQPYYTMELLEDAQTVIAAGRDQQRIEQVGLLIQILQALAYLHRRGIIHRDVKPGNVMVANQQVKVLDFGLSIMRGQAAEKAGQTSGTLAYLAPEIWNGQPASELADLYAVGIIAYELLIGHHPFNLENFEKLADDVLNSQPNVSAVEDNQKLALALRRLLAKSPQDRYADANQAIAALCDAVDIPLPEETAAVRESYLQAASLIGREAELEQLSAVLSQAVQGKGSAILIGGESGVGKSRLLDELRTLALVEGALVLRGQAVSAGGRVYELWRDLLRWLSLFTELRDEEASFLKIVVPDLSTLLGREIPDPPALDPRAAHDRFLAVVESVFKRQGQPTVVILEDLHWSQESLDILARLVSQVNSLPLLIIGSFRDDERPDLPEKLPTMQLIKLKRLPNESIAALSESMLGAAGRQPAVVELLQRETEGNVFFLVEVVRVLAEESGQLNRIGSTTLPQSVFAGGMKQIIQRRLNRIPGEARPLLETAAVAGRVLDLNVLRTVSPDTDLDKWLDICSAVAVLDVQDGHWRFAHDKLRDGALVNLTDEQTGALHRQIAIAIETDYPDVTGHSAALAYHWGNAGNREKEAQYAILAGDESARLYAYVQTGRLYARALEALTHLPDSDENRRSRVDTTLKYVTVSWVAERPESNLARLTEIEPIAQALATSATQADRLRLARTHYWIGRTYSLMQNVREAIRYYMLTVAVGQEYGDEELLAIPSGSIGRAFLVQGHFGRARPYLAQAIAPLEKASNWSEWIGAKGFYGVSLAASGNYGAGTKEAQEGLTKAIEMNFPMGMAFGHVYMTAAQLLGGNIPMMLEQSQGIIDKAEASGDRLLAYVGYGFRGWAQSRLSDHKKAAESMAKSREISQTLGTRVLLGDWFAAAQAEVAFNLGNTDDALTLAQKANEIAKAVGGVFAEGFAQRVWAQALAAVPLPKWDEVDAHIGESLKAFETGECIVEVARTRRVWVDLLTRRGDTDAAREQASQVVTAFEASSLTDELASARAALANLMTE